MKDFYVHIPTKLFFGASKEADFITEVIRLGKKILVVTGGGSIKKHGFYEPIISSLKESGGTVFEFSGIEPNPLAKTIDRCFEENKSNSIEVVLAFGGGSVMDAAKAISALLYLDLEQSKSNFKDLPKGIWNYVLGSDKVGMLPGALPVVTIPTTAATASEVTPYAVISNDEVQGKSPLAYEFFKPLASYLNPVYTTRLPLTTTQDGAADILSHVFENYLIGGNDATFTDLYCEGIIKTVIENLPKVLEDPYNENLRGDLQWCSTLALNGLHSAGREPSPFPLHAIEHSMSAVQHSLAHGRGLATLFPAYFRWLWNNNRGRDRLNRLGVKLFNLPTTQGETGLHFIDHFEKWLSTCGLLQSAKDLGFTDADYETIANYSVKVYGDGESIPVLGPMTASDIVEILKLSETQKAK